MKLNEIFVYRLREIIIIIQLIIKFIVVEIIHKTKRIKYY